MHKLIIPVVVNVLVERCLPGTKKPLGPKVRIPRWLSDLMCVQHRQMPYCKELGEFKSSSSHSLRVLPSLFTTFAVYANKAETLDYKYIQKEGNHDKKRNKRTAETMKLKQLFVGL